MSDWMQRIAEFGEEAKEEILGAPLEKRLQILAKQLDVGLEEASRWLSEMSQLELRETFELCDKIEDCLPLPIIHEYLCLPIKSSEAAFDIISGWPLDKAMLSWIRVTCGFIPRCFLGNPEEIRRVAQEKFGLGAESFLAGNEDIKSSEETIEEDEDAVIIKFVNEVIRQALQDRATDIHFEPQKKLLQIRYRIDGVLVPVKLPQNLHFYQAAIISRLKIMARLNISEKRRPQDGRITFQLGSESVDIRVSTLPVVYGESISLRLLDQGSAPITLEDLYLSPKEYQRIEFAIKKPHGIILVTGPTGSGKSTTLGACVRKIRSPELRIITVEDPVEYEVVGVNQVQVQSDIGMTFASALRSILRQDPDVIMIGEIRDQETADIAIRASITGHLVLSTLHTNDAAGAVTRLLDMGLEPFLLASSLEVVIAQRLMRRLCPHCAKPTKSSRGEIEKYLTVLGIDASESEYYQQVMEPVGCEQCRQLGYCGRIGVYEILKMSDSIHDAIVHNQPASEIRGSAVQEGMLTLQQSAWNQVKQGRTSLSVIMRLASDAEV
ncbi:MAG: GspE/PulE family protein [Puniceicoccales bacterium]|jgi:type II secretory ATPase GspE/PulE/Tfp pilus assembly ATPase PilB-like protein|nr:GspE/PulE family protein [Puniceicoccales bacterium]